MEKLYIFGNVRAILFTGLAIVSFTHFLIQLFGQTIPNIIWSFFRDVGGIIILASIFIFAVIWFLNTRHHIRPKNYSVICYDVFGNESSIEGLRTEFKIHDVAWSFMKNYKKSYPLYNFALVSDLTKSSKKTILRYL